MFYVGVAVDPDDIVEVFTSDTDQHEKVQWEKLDCCHINVTGSYVQFAVTHFSLFTVVVTKKRPKVSQIVNDSTEGTINIYIIYLFI